MKISIVVAVSTNNVIGKAGGLPWRLSEDLRHFKKITMGKPVVMGRATWESIGRALPGRQNIVLSRRAGCVAEGCDVAATVDAALAIAGDAEELMIIGGSHVYEQFLPQTDCIYMTRIHRNVEGDTFFPALDESAWQTIACDSHAACAERDYAFDFLTMKRIR